MRAFLALIAIFALLCLVSVEASVFDRLIEATKKKNQYTISFQRTLHGLWPDWGFNCGTEQFDESQVQPIISTMENEWHSCPEFHKSNNDFWSHEWSKHGTCTGFSQLKYFSTGLDLLDKLSSKCNPAATGECRFCLTMDLEIC